MLPSRRRIHTARHNVQTYCTVGLEEPKTTSAIATIYKFSSASPNEESTDTDLCRVEADISSGELNAFGEPPDFLGWIVLASSAQDTGDPVDIQCERDRLRASCESGNILVATLVHTNRVVPVRVTMANFHRGRRQMPDPVVGYGVIHPHDP